MRIEFNGSSTFASLGAGVARRLALALALLAGALLVTACQTGHPEAPQLPTSDAATKDYVIGPGDELQVFVWRQPELSTKVPVRPDGRISVPLIPDVMAAGKSPSELGDELTKSYLTYVQEPNVTVIVTKSIGPFSEQIRVVGEATKPQAIPYRQGMTVLDAAIEVGGLTKFAAGNRAVIVRRATPEAKEEVYRVRLDDLLRNGDVTANVSLVPGDVVIIPEKRF